jgi:hypothetical protein
VKSPKAFRNTRRNWGLNLSFKKRFFVRTCDFLHTLTQATARTTTRTTAYIMACSLVFSACNGIGQMSVSGIVSTGSSSVSFNGLTSISNVGGTFLTLNWTNVSGAASYDIYNTTTGVPLYVATLSAPASSYVVTGLAVSTSYRFRVRMTDTSGLMDANTNDLSATTLSTLPPQNLVYSQSSAVYTIGSAITTISPSSSGPPVVSYSIAPGLPAGLSFNTTTGLITGTPTALSALTTYTVTATNAGGSTTASLPITVNFAGIASISNIGGVNVQVNWSVPSGANPAPASYSVYNTTSGSPVFVASVSAPTTSYIVTGLTASTSYTFQVRMTDTTGLTDSNTTTQSATTLSYIATFQGWSNAQILGAKTPAPQATDLTSAPAQVTLSWNAVTLNTGVVSSYDIYRVTTSGSENYASPFATGITTSALSYTDTTVSSGTTYYYTIAPVVAGGVVPPTVVADSEISLLVPPANMALIHPWVANQEICGLMGLSGDRTNNYRCSYSGPGNVSGYYNLSKAITMDTYGEGCNYKHGTDCSGGDCIGTTGAPAAGVGVNGDVYYDRSTANCYIKSAGSWTTGNNASSAQLAQMMSNAPGLPPLVVIDQTQSWNACNAITVSGYTHSERLPKHSEQIIAAAWSPSLTDSQISALESDSGGNLYSTHACNAASGSGLTYSTATIPTDLNTISGEGSTGSIYSVRTGSTATTSCVSRYGIQDMVGNVWQWSSDQLATCYSTSPPGGTPVHSCQGETSTLDSGNTDWNGFNFDGTIGPGGTTNTGGTLSSENLGGPTFNSFQIPLGLPMVTASLSAWDSLAIGTGVGQFNPVKFHGNYFWLYTDNGNGVPARGAFAGGAWSYGSDGGRFALSLSGTPSVTFNYLGFRCLLPAN